MKIALVCPDGLSIVLFCKGIIRALRRMEGAEVVVISDEGEHRAGVEALGARSISVPISRYVTPMADLVYCRRLWQVFRRERFDLVMNFSTKPNIYGAFAACAAGVPRVISHVVGLGGAFLPSSNWKSKLIRSLSMALYLAAGKCTDRIWFTNRNDLRFFVERGFVKPERAVLTHNYLDTDEYSESLISLEEIQAVRRELQIESSRKVVIMVARLVWSKGIREFLEASDLLRPRLPELEFLLVAPHENGNTDAVPESYVRSAERRGNFRWLGFRSDVKRLYALSCLAVLPTYYKEGGYPRGLLEPMSMGRPIITSTSEDCRAVVEEGLNGYLVPVKNSVALADAIERIIRNPDACRSFGRYSREKAVREFDERMIIDRAFRELGITARLEEAVRCSG